MSSDENRPASWVLVDQVQRHTKFEELDVKFFSDNLWMFEKQMKHAVEKLWLKKCADLPYSKLEMTALPIESFDHHTIQHSVYEPMSCRQFLESADKTPDLSPEICKTGWEDPIELYTSGRYYHFKYTLCKHGILYTVIKHAGVFY